MEKSMEIEIKAIRRLKKEIKKNKKKAFKSLISILYNIVDKHYGGAESEKESKYSKLLKTREGFKSTSKLKDTKKILSIKYDSKDFKIIKRCIYISIKEIPEYIKRALSTNKKLHEHPLWKEYRFYVKIYLNCLINILNNTNGNKEIIKILSFINKSFCLLFTYSKICKLIINKLIEFSIHDSSKIRLLSIDVLKLFTRNDARFNDIIIKKLIGVYVKLYKSCCIYENNVILDFLTCNIVELINMYPVVSSKVIEKSVKLIAKCVQEYMNSKDKKNISELYGWPIIGKLDLYYNILLKVNDNKDINLLKFPLIEITLTIIRLNESYVYYPSHLHMLRFILRLCKPIYYVPLTSYIFKILLSSEITSYGKKSNEKTPLIHRLNHIPSNMLHSNIIKECIFDEAFDIFLRYILVISQTIAFPEYTTILNRYYDSIKSTIKVKSIKKRLDELFVKINKTSQSIISLRSCTNFTPLQNDKIIEWENTTLNLENSNFNEIYNYFKKWDINRKLVLTPLL